MIRVGLIGYGLAGKVFHAPLIDAVPQLELTAVATSRVDEVAADWPGTRAVADPDALIADAAIDLVVIATPNATHAPLARAALDAGKHVVIDKPFVVDPADGTALIDLARKRGRVLSVFHNRRWDGDFRTVRALIQSGRLGEVMLYEARWDRFRPALREGWKEAPDRGAGLLPDLGSHLIDQALQLFGRPDAVSADLGCQRPGSRIEDYVELTLHYGAMRAILSASIIVAAARPRFAVHGTRGSFVKHGLDPQEDAMKHGFRPDSAGFGEDTPDAYGLITDTEGSTRVPTERGDYRCFYQGVAAAIRDGAPPPVDPADALAAIDLIALARRSAAEGRRIDLV